MMIESKDLMQVISENAYKIITVDGSTDRGMTITGIEQAINEAMEVKFKRSLCEEIDNILLDACEGCESKNKCEECGMNDNLVKKLKDGVVRVLKLYQLPNWGGDLK